MSGIFQDNLGRKRVSHDLVLATANAREVDILVVGESNYGQEGVVQGPQGKRRPEVH